MQLHVIYADREMVVEQKSMIKIGFAPDLDHQTFMSIIAIIKEFDGVYIPHTKSWVIEKQAWHELQTWLDHRETDDYRLPHGFYKSLVEFTQDE